MNKRIGIEALLAWAYGEELPKAGAGRQKLTGIGYGNAWRSILGYGQLMTLVDESGRNAYGVIADPDAEGEPHPDAIRVHAAVVALNGLEIDLPEDWDPLADMVDIEPERPGLIAAALCHVSVLDGEGIRRIKGDLSALIIKHAVLGGCPDWLAEMPERRFVMANGGAGGRPAWFRKIVVETPSGPIESEVEGFDLKRRRPMAGAYRKTFLDPDPAVSARCRAEYEIWQSALAWLAVHLAGTLESFDIAPFERPARPWEQAPELAPRILPNLRTPSLVQNRDKRRNQKAR